MDSPAFNVWSTVLLLLLIIMCILMHIFTIKGLLTGKILGLTHGWSAKAYDEDHGDKEV